MTRFGRVEPLAADHDVTAFDCGSEAQTTWLRRHALQAHRSDTTKVYVVCQHGTRVVVGYYALTAGSVSHADAPPRVTKGIGRYPVPVVILTRLGVALDEQGRGLGSELTRDAFLQVAAVAERVGVRALLIHAETPEAVVFYQQIDGSFVESPTDPLQLVLLIKDLRLAVRDAAMLRGATTEVDHGPAGAMVPSDPDDRAARIQRAISAVGSADSGTGDVSANHDDIAGDAVW